MVQRAREGATWWRFPSYVYADGELCLIGPWEPKRFSADDWLDYDARIRAHWVEWYRDTARSRAFFDGFVDYIEDPHPDREAYCEANDALREMRIAFEVSIDALGSLCQLPAAWTDEHRAEAQRIAASAL